LVIYELPRITEQLSSDRKKNVIVIYGLLHLFVSDPHIDKADAKQLVKEIAASIRKMSVESFVVISTTQCNHKYEKHFLPAFDKVIRITNNIENSKVLQVSVHNQNDDTEKEDIRSAISIMSCKRELMLVPSRVTSS
jgi:hypothetical protein